EERRSPQQLPPAAAPCRGEEDPAVGGVEVTAALAPINLPSVDFVAIAPELALGGAAVLIVLARALLRRHRAAVPVAYALAAAGVLTSGGLLVWQWQRVGDAGGAIGSLAGKVQVDRFAVFLGIVVLTATALALLLAVAYLHREGLEAPEYLALMLFS